MSNYACGGTIPNYICNPCGVGEKGRISDLALVKEGKTFMDPSNATEWQDAITAGDVIIVPETRGGLAIEPIKGPGFGRQKEKLVGYNFTATTIAGNYKANCGFWNSVSGSNIFKLAYCTETSVHITDTVVSIIPTAPIEDNLDTDVDWNIEFAWTQKKHPCAYDTPAGVFECFTEG